MNRYCAAGVLMLAAGVAYGQNPPGAAVKVDPLKQAFAALPDKTVMCGPVRPVSDGVVPEYCRRLHDLIDPRDRRVDFAAYVISSSGSSDQAFSSALSSFASSRLDVQNTAPASSPGATSVAERAGISSLLGAALDAGAVTQSVSGSTLTLQANALSLSRFLEGQKYIFQYCSDGGTSCQGVLAPILNAISGSVALSVSNSTQAVSGMVTGASGTGSVTPSATALIQNSSSRLSSFTIKAQIYNKLDLHNKVYLDKWKAGFKTAIPAAATLVSANDTAFAWLKNDEVFREWFTNAETAVRAWLSAPGTTTADDLVSGQWNNLVTAERGNSLNLDQFYQAAEIYLQARDAENNSIRQQLANGISFSYTFSQPQSQPKISTPKLIYTVHPGASATNRMAARHDYSISVNLGADLYNSPPPGTHTLKDLQAALQLDYHFGTSTNSAVGTLAGYYQYQSSASAIMIGAGNLAPGTNIMLPGTAATLLAPKGHIWVVEGLVTFPVLGGANIPVGLTWSNRTELINAQEVRGHVGFNFDWSSLFAAKQSTKN